MYTFVDKKISLILYTILKNRDLIAVFFKMVYVLSNRTLFNNERIK